MNSELNEHLAEARVADWRRDADRFRQVHAGSGEPAEEDGSSVADRFRPTAHLTELLELRAAHLRDSSDAGAHRWRRWSRRRALSAPRWPGSK